MYHSPSEGPAIYLFLEAFHAFKNLEWSFIFWMMDWPTETGVSYWIWMNYFRSSPKFDTLNNRSWHFFEVDYYSINYLTSINTKKMFFNRRRKRLFFVFYFFVLNILKLKDIKTKIFTSIEDEWSKRRQSNNQIL